MNIEIDDIKNDDQRNIAKLIGIDAYMLLVYEYGGTSLYIQKKDTLLKDKRDAKIKEEFNGGNYVYLARKYGLTERYVRDIIGNDTVIKGQIRFDL